MALGVTSGVSLFYSKLRIYANKLIFIFNHKGNTDKIFYVAFGNTAKLLHHYLLSSQAIDCWYCPGERSHLTGILNDYMQMTFDANVLKTNIIKLSSLPQQGKTRSIMNA